MEEAEDSKPPAKDSPKQSNSSGSSGRVDSDESLLKEALATATARSSPEDGDTSRADETAEDPPSPNWTSERFSF